ncbi:MAG: hypothetical protein HC875_02445 [Anaerolineales bacterium]|nr:hypothetical protein [Anaerolineales bacterium]
MSERLGTGSHFYRSSALQVYEDPEITRLHHQIEFLLQELIGLQAVKSDIEQQIQMLHTRHHQELRPLVVELLELRQTGRQKAATVEPELPETDAQNEPEPAEENALVAPSKLSPAEQRALKEMFRQASKLCHPDLVAEEFKAEAGIIFIELKTAYEQQDLPRVEEILHVLERGEKLTRQPALSHSKDKLRAEVGYLRRRVTAIRQQIAMLKQSNPYKKLVNIEDWDDYFDELKGELQRKINRLKRRKQPAEGA